MKLMVLSAMCEGMSYERKEIVDIGRKELKDLLLPYGRDISVQYSNFMISKDYTDPESYAEESAEFMNEITSNRPYFVVLIDERYLSRTRGDDAKKIQEIYSDEDFFEYDFEEVFATKTLEFVLLKATNHIERAIYVFREIEGDNPFAFEEDKKAREVIQEFKELVKSEFPDRVIEYKMSFDEKGIADEGKLQMLREKVFEKLAGFVEAEYKEFGEINDEQLEQYKFYHNKKNFSLIEDFKTRLEELRFELEFLAKVDVNSEAKKGEAAKKEEAAKLAHVLGILHSNLFGKKAENYFKESLKLRQELVNREGTPESRENLAYVYANLGLYYINKPFFKEFEKAEELLGKSLLIRTKLHEELNNALTKENLAVAYSNLGNLHFNLGTEESLQKAHELYQESYTLLEELEKELHTKKRMTEPIIQLLKGLKARKKLGKNDKIDFKKEFKGISTKLSEVEVPMSARGTEFSMIAYGKFPDLFVGKIKG